MIVAVIILAIALAGAIGAQIYLVNRGERRVDMVLAGGDKLAATRDALMLKTIAGERSDFELKQAQAALTLHKARADALEEYVAHDAAETDPNADLAPDDVAGRVLRLSRRWGAAAAEAHPGSAVRAGGEPAVHSTAAEEAPGPDGLLRPE